MQNLKLQECRNAKKRLERLEELHEKAVKIRKKEEYLADWKAVLVVWQQCKVDAEQIIQGLARLSDEEKEMARNYYIEGQSWEDAFAFSAAYQNLPQKKADSEASDRMLQNYKKHIERCVNQCV